MADDIKVVGLSNQKGAKKTDWKVMGALIGVIVLGLGIVAGIILVRQSQDIREKAGSSCPGAEDCSGAGGIIRSCHPPDDDGTPAESICNSAFKGRVETCGAEYAEYCCNGTSWTTNMSACESSPSPTASPSPSASPSASSSGTPTATATPTKTATPTSTATSYSGKTSTPTSTSTSSSTATATSSSTKTATPFPVPDTGASLPTIIGAGLGVLLLVGSLLLVF